MNLHPFQPEAAEPDDELSRRLTRALSAAPAFNLPEGFVTHTAAAARALPAARAVAPNFAARTTRYSSPFSPWRSGPRLTPSPIPCSRC
jgi:hypothetical protein